MNSMKETILTRWNDLSVAAKDILRNKELLKLENMPQALDLLSQISLLTSQDLAQKHLIMTYHVSDAIFISMLLQEANPDLSLKLLLPHQVNNDNLDATNIIIAPFSSFLFADTRHESFSLTDFTTVTLDHKIATAFITEQLMANEAHKALLNEQSGTVLLFTDFQTITDSLQPKQAVTPIETLKPKREKISLAKSQDLKKAPKEADEINEIAAEAKDKQQDAKPAKKQVAAKTAAEVTTPVAEKATETATSSVDATSEEKDPAAFIAVVARNVQRQYIRDYIREHNLQHVLIVTHNRQSARLLEKYLYRARIRSRVVHEKIDEDTATSLFDRYNEGQFTAMILMHRVVEDLAAKIQKCDSVIFLDFPTVYSEYANRLEFVQTHFKPQHFISISTENDRAWVQALLEEYPDLDLPLVEVDIKPPKKRPNQPRPQAEKAQAAVTQDNEVANVAEQAPPAPAIEATENNEEESVNNDNPRERRNNRQTQPRQNRNDQRNDRNERNSHNNSNRRDNSQRTNRRRQEPSANHQQPDHGNQEFGDSQSDFFSANQDEIVNHNRLPFGAGSFEANIARENRRRGRDAFNTPGGIGQSTNGNFLQNITQGLNGNGNNNSQPQNRRHNNNNNSNNNNSNNSSNNNNRNRPRKNNRKK